MMQKKKKDELDNIIKHLYLLGIVALFVVVNLSIFAPMPVAVAATLYFLTIISQVCGIGFSFRRFHDNLEHPESPIDFLKGFSALAIGSTSTGAAVGLLIGSIIAPGVGSLILMGIGAGVGFCTCTIAVLILNAIPALIHYKSKDAALTVDKQHEKVAQMDETLTFSHSKDPSLNRPEVAYYDHPVVSKEHSIDISQNTRPQPSK